MSQLNFTLEKYEAPQIELIPEGRYVAKIISTELKETKANPDNKYLEIIFKVISGSCCGRSVFDRLNIEHTNQEAQKMSRQRLSWLAHVLGIDQLLQTEQLHNKPLSIYVTKEKSNNPNYGDSNRVRKFERLNTKIENGSDGSSDKEFNDALPF